jgi:hypothetical protein
MAVRRKPKQTRKPKPTRYPKPKKRSDLYNKLMSVGLDVEIGDPPPGPPDRPGFLATLVRIADAAEHIADQLTELVSSVGEIETGQAVLFEQGVASGKMQRKLVTQLQALTKTQTERTDMFDRAAAAVAQHLAEIASNG